MLIKPVSLSRRDIVDCTELYCSKQQFSTTAVV